MLYGAPFDNTVRSKIPGVGELTYFNSMPDMLLALKEGKTDAGVSNNAVAALSINKDGETALFPKDLERSSFGFAFAKGSKERKVWQEAFDRITEDEKKAMWEKWTGADTSKKVLPAQDWPGNGGTVKVAACDTLEPMSYMGEDGEVIGFDIEMILRMAKELDVHVEFTGMEFSAIMPSVETGKALFGTGSIIVTEERSQVVDFIEYYPSALVLVVRKASEDAVVSGNGILDSFHRTFIAEGRYRMFLSGLLVTVFMAVSAGVLGTLLAFALVFLKHRDHPITNRIIGVYRSLIAGIPSVIILMVLYYLIFGAVQIPAVIVAIVGFSLIFGGRAYQIIWNAVNAVDAGQREAALALGYSEKKAFREVILPQSSGIYKPLLQAQYVMLLKETSIAGFITVLELTRVGDLIRSRTMEAFFPLIVVAAIYFLLTRLLTFIATRISRRQLKKRDARKIKGVD